MPDYREPEPEVIETTAREVPHDPATGVIHEERAQVAIGGGILPPPASRAGDLVNMLEDGQLSYEMQQEMQEVAERVREIAARTGGKAKGKITLELTLIAEGEGDALQFEGKIKKSMPELPRRRSILWQDDSGNFTSHPPRQVPMFGQQVPIRRVG